MPSLSLWDGWLLSYNIPLLQVTCCEAGRVFRVARAPVPGEHHSPSIGCADGHMDGQADTGAAGVWLISVSETLIFLWKTLFPKGAAGGGTLPTETAAGGFLAL